MSLSGAVGLLLLNFLKLLGIQASFTCQLCGQHFGFDDKDTVEEMMVFHLKKVHPKQYSEIKEKLERDYTRNYRTK